MIMWLRWPALLDIGADDTARNAGNFQPGAVARDHPGGQVYNLFVQRGLSYRGGESEG